MEQGCEQDACRDTAHPLQQVLAKGLCLPPCPAWAGVRQGTGTPSGAPGPHPRYEWPLLWLAHSPSPEGKQENALLSSGCSLSFSFIPSACMMRLGMGKLWTFTHIQSSPELSSSWQPRQCLALTGEVINKGDVKNSELTEAGGGGKQILTHRGLCCACCGCCQCCRAGLGLCVEPGDEQSLLCQPSPGSSAGCSAHFTQ